MLAEMKNVDFKRMLASFQRTGAFKSSTGPTPQVFLLTIMFLYTINDAVTW